MKRGVLILFLAFVLFIPVVSSGSIDSEIQKITSYAEDYETGNINYVQLLVYTSSVREKMNNVLGASEKELGGVLKQQQIQSVLGEPNERTKWVWAEGLEYELKLDNDVPVWRKIIFDGKKIQIRLNAYPSIFVKQNFDFKTEEEKEEFKKQSSAELKNKEFTQEDVIYRLNIEISFKKPQDQLDIAGRIDDIQILAQNFNSDSSNENAEKLAKAGVDAEKLFWNYFEQSSGKCENLMSSIFGSENKRETQNLLVQEIDFYSGENFQATARLEMCDDCENNNWINLDMWFDTRGKIKLPEDMKNNGEQYSKEKYASMTNEDFQSEIAGLLDKIKESLNEKDFSSAFSSVNELRMLNNAWNEKANNVWKELDEVYKAEEQSMTEEERQKLGENYGWIKREQERRQKEREIRKQNYEERKQFYLNLFSDYDKREFYYTQIQFEKRLVEEFKEFGQEVCDNNQDDNEDGNIDCADSQCGGKICGKQASSVSDGNETSEKNIDLYCIASICQAKEEIVEEQAIICGNHVCELNETKENCAEDCSDCQAYDAVNCSGKVIFSGTDINNCPLAPICIEESNSCTLDEDCAKPLCGEVACVEGKCELTTLTECTESQCNEGEKKILRCDAGEEIVNSICDKGVWNDLGTECLSVGTSENEFENEVIEEKIGGEIIEAKQEILGNACSVREDCGNINDVCSNGNCVTIPEIVKVEEEISEEPLEESQETTSEEPPVTGSVILEFFKNTLGGFVLTITGLGVEGEAGIITDTPPEGGNTVTNPEPPSGGEAPQENQQEDNFQDNREDERRQEERERRKNECGEQCDRMCYDNKVRPCVGDCIKESCGNELECNIDDETQACEDKCKDENNLDDCIDSCSPKCLEGKNEWWKEFEFKPEENKQMMEKGVFNMGGGCRTSQGKTEAFIWFGGWGDPFERIEPLKQKYYSGGQTEWCKYDLENLEKQRAEFEKGFNQEFVNWFFEDYLASSAEDWEQHVSGIFEIYWKNVDNLRETANRMGCLGITEFPTTNLISVQYESEYGKIEYWEELKTVKMPELDNKEITIVSPYMKFWIFPPKEFLKYEMKKAMTSGEFPGAPEDKRERENQEGLTEEEKQSIKQNEAFMNKIKKLSEKYNGNFDLVAQLKDFEANEVVFNLYVQINEEDIITMQPMLPENNPQEDARIEIDFQEVYDLVYSMQKEMDGERIESPPWDRKSQEGGIKQMTNGIKIYLKVRGLLNSANVYPAEAESDVRDLVKTVLKMMMKGESGEGGEGEGEATTKEQAADKTLWEEAEKNSGEQK